MAPTKILEHMLAIIWLGVSVSALSDVEDLGQSEATFDMTELLGQGGQGDPNPDMTQREVTFDLADIWGLEESDTDNLMQKEVTFDLPDFLKEKVSNYSGPDITQREITDELAVALTPRGPAQFGPRGYKPHHVASPHRVAFPPGRPTSENIQAICRHGTGRPRYPPGALPHSGFGHLYRQADAIHRTEAWYNQQCCQGNWQQKINKTLCCAHQAWTKALDLFCEDEFSVKTSHYHCCKVKAEARLNCFDREAPNPSYGPTTHYSGPELLPRGQVFTFTNNCPRMQRKPKAAAAPRAMRGEPIVMPDIHFPPGRPTSSNIKLVCKLRKLRPRYVASCLPRGGYGWLARQSKAINRLERGLKRCCKGKKNVLACADEKWREEMNRFCEDEHSVKTKHYLCCKKPEGDERFSCFSSNAPHPNYTAELLQKEKKIVVPHLGLVCEIHKILKKVQGKVPVAAVVKKCCHLVQQQRNACVQDMLDTLQKEKCSAEPPSPMVTPDCCAPNPTNCFSDLLMESIENAVKTPGFKRRKCPLLIV